jgi:hypothetical protein
MPITALRSLTRGETLPILISNHARLVWNEIRIVRENLATETHEFHSGAMTANEQKVSDAPERQPPCGAGGGKVEAGGKARRMTRRRVRSTAGLGVAGIGIGRVA